jgi:hypothetical protein
MVEKGVHSQNMSVLRLPNAYKSPQFRFNKVLSMILLLKFKKIIMGEKG